MTAHERDRAVAKFIQMTKRQLSGLALVEDHIGDAVNVAMGGHGDGGHRKIVVKRGIHEDESLGSAAHQQARILVYQLGLMAMMRGELEIALLHQVIADTAEHLGVIALTQFRHQDADGMGATIAQGAGEQAGLIVELLCSGLDAIARGLRNGPARHVIQHYGDGCWT